MCFLSLLSLSPISNPITFLLSLIYSFRLVGESWLPLISLVWVGPKLIILDKGYASLGMVSRTLELTPTSSKRLLGSAIPHGTLELLRHFCPSHGYLLTILHVGGIHVSSFMNSEPIMTLGLCLTIFMVLFRPGPKINGLVAICHTNPI